MITVGSRPESIAVSSDRPMPAVDAVERADRDRARPALELRRCVRDPHAPAPPRAGAAPPRGHHALLVGLLDRERPDLRSSQRDAVASERVGDRADVRSRADEQVERHDAVGVRDELELVDTHHARRHLDGDALAVQPIGALAVDLHGRRGRDRQLDLAAKARRARLLELVVVRRRRASRRTSPSGSPVVVRS